MYAMPSRTRVLPVYFLFKRSQGLRDGVKRRLIAKNHYAHIPVVPHQARDGAYGWQEPEASLARQIVTSTRRGLERFFVTHYLREESHVGKGLRSNRPARQHGNVIVVTGDRSGSCFSGGR